MLNSVSLQGRLTHDPEKRYAEAQNISVVRFTIAVDRDYKDKSGEKQTDFISCAAFRKTADYIADYFGKGDMVAVNGRLQISSWTDKNDSKHNDCQIIVTSLYPCGKKSAKDSKEAELKPVEVEDDYLPF